MAALKAVGAIGASHLGADRHGVVLELPQRIGSDETVQFLAVDLNRIVEGSSPEPVPPFARRGIEVRSAIGHDVETVEEQLEAENVVVAVAAASAESHFTAIDYEMRLTRPQHVEAAVGEGDRPTF